MYDITKEVFFILFCFFVFLFEVYLLGSFHCHKQRIEGNTCSDVKEVKNVNLQSSLNLHDLFESLMSHGSKSLYDSYLQV